MKSRVETRVHSSAEVRIHPERPHSLGTEALGMTSRCEIIELMKDSADINKLIATGVRVTVL